MHNIPPDFFYWAYCDSLCSCDAARWMCRLPSSAHRAPVPGSGSLSRFSRFRGNTAKNGFRKVIPLGYEWFWAFLGILAISFAFAMILSLITVLFREKTRVNRHDTRKEADDCAEDDG